MTHYDAETRAQLAAIRRVKEAVEERPLRIPSVGGMGISLKTVGGKRSADFAVIVYPAQKKPLSEVPPEEIIPSEIDAVEGDARERGRFRALVIETPVRSLHRGQRR
jgi:hypothetical protein